jgi:hypothetical protein
VLDHDRARSTTRTRAVTGSGHRADHDLPVGRALDETGRQMRREDGSGDERPAELFEHHGRGGGAQPEAPPVFRKSQGEHAGVGELGPPRCVDGHALALGATYPIEREASGAQPTHAVGQRYLVLGKLEVHGCLAYPLGSPRIRSAMMLRWICDVPAAIVREKPCTQVLTISRFPTAAASPGMSP